MTEERNNGEGRREKEEMRNGLMNSYTNLSRGDVQREKHGDNLLGSVEERDTRTAELFDAHRGVEGHGGG